MSTSIFHKILKDMGVPCDPEHREELEEENRLEAMAWLKEHHAPEEYAHVHIETQDVLFVRDSLQECENCPGLEKCPRGGFVPSLHFPLGRTEIQVKDCPLKREYLWTRKLGKMLERSMLPEELRRHGFNNFDTARHPDCLKMCEAAKASWKGHTSLVLSSTTNGNGKTHLASAIINCAARKGVAGLFISVPEMIDALRLEAVQRGSRDENTSVMQLLQNAEFLVLDDFGKERVTSFVGERIFMIIDQRERHHKPVVITTNRETPDELEYRMGDHGKAIVSRLCMMCGPDGWITSSAPDYRTTREGCRKYREYGERMCS